VAEDRAADACYFQAVEHCFVELRGDPLMLSNADWFLVWKWRRAGLPLRVVLRGIADAMESHALSWSRDRKVSSLSYCRAEVERAARRWREDLAPEASAPLAAGATLERIASALESAALGEVAGERLRALAEGLRARARRARRGPALDRWLAEREQELVQVLLDTRPPLEREALEAEVAAGLAGFRSRLPERVLAQVEAEARARVVLGVCGLPRLSLFEAGDA
jgi:hypothetical protein